MPVLHQSLYQLLLVNRIYIITIKHYNYLYSLRFYERLGRCRRSDIDRFLLLCHVKNAFVYIIKEVSTIVNTPYVC